VDNENNGLYIDNRDDLPKSFTVAFDYDNEDEEKAARWIIDSCAESDISRNEFLRHHLVRASKSRSNIPSLKEASEVLLQVIDPAVRQACEEAAKEWLNIPLWQVICGQLNLSFDRGELHAGIMLPEWGDEGFEEPKEAECKICGCAFWPVRRGQIAPNHECVNWSRRKERGEDVPPQCLHRTPEEVVEDASDSTTNTIPETTTATV